MDSWINYWISYFILLILIVITKTNSLKMVKIHWSQWLGAIPFVILTILLLIGYFATGITIILNLIFVSFLLLIYILTYVFGPNFFELGERDMGDDVELLKLEKNNLALLWASTSGIGIAFLISGMANIAETPLMATMGLFLLSVGNLIWMMFYYPRYALLVRKRKNIINLKEETLGEIVSFKDDRVVAYLKKKK